MTKNVKKIFLILCSFVFVVSLGFFASIGFNTNNTFEAKADATPTVAFSGVVEVTTGYYERTIFRLNFDGDFTEEHAPSATIDSKIYYTAPDNTTHTFSMVLSNHSFWQAQTNEVGLVMNEPVTILEGSVLTVTEGTVIGGQVLPSVTLYYLGGVWKDTVTFTGIDGGNNAVEQIGYKFTHLQFNGANFGWDVHYAGDLNIKNKIYWTAYGKTTRNYFNYIVGYTDLRLMDAAGSFPTVGATIYIEDGTTINGNVLPAVTLYVGADGKWTETPFVVAPTVTFTGIGSRNNTGAIFGDAYPALDLQFSGDFIETNATASVTDLIYYTTPNGEKCAFDWVLSAFSDWSVPTNTIELVMNNKTIPIGSVLTITECTEIGGQVLPEITLYLNDFEQWQIEEYIYEEIEPIEVTLKEVDFAYNNCQNPWRAEFLLSKFVFSDILSRKAVGGGAFLEKLELKVWSKKLEERTVALGEDFSISTQAKTTDMHVQYPKLIIPAFDENSARIELALTEDVAYGNVIIKAFRLVLNDYYKWVIVDESYTTPPTIIYNGQTEITTSASKPFIIDVFAVNKEEECKVFYAWSDGAIDEQDNLVKGNHTCTIVAMDTAGNKSELLLTVNVLDKDTEPPRYKRG